MKNCEKHNDLTSNCKISALFLYHVKISGRFGLNLKSGLTNKSSFQSCSTTRCHFRYCGEDNCTNSAWCPTSTAWSRALEARRWICRYSKATATFKKWPIIKSRSKRCGLNQSTNPIWKIYTLVIFICDWSVLDLISFSKYWLLRTFVTKTRIVHKNLAQLQYWPLSNKAIGQIHAVKVATPIQDVKDRSI